MTQNINCLKLAFSLPNHIKYFRAYHSPQVDRLNPSAKDWSYLSLLLPCLDCKTIISGKTMKTMVPEDSLQHALS